MPSKFKNWRGGPTALFFLSLLTAFLLVAGVGYYSHRSLNRMVKNLREESQPQVARLDLQQILYDLSRIQSGVRAFSITGDAFYLRNYDPIRDKIQETVDHLSSQFSADKVSFADTIRSLVQSEFDALDSIVVYESSDMIEQYFTEVNEGLTQARRITRVRENQNSQEKKVTEPGKKPAVEAENQLEEENKPGFFKRLFGGKDKDDEKDSSGPEKEEKRRRKKDKNNDEVEEAVATDEGPAEKMDEPIVTVQPTEAKALKTVEKSVKKAEKKAENVRLMRDFVQEEYTAREDSVMESLQGYLASMEVNQVRESMIRAEAASSTTTQTTRLITGLISIAILLLLLSGVALAVSFSRVRKFNGLLQVQKARAEAMAEARERFLSIMSHEMRNPLNAISGFSRELKSSDLEKNQYKQLDMISTAASHLSKVVNEVLDDARLESGQFVFEDAPFSLRGEMEKVAALLENQLKSDDVKIEIEVPDDLPEAVKGDAFRFRQIMLNLGGNAVKFTTSGFVKLKCKKWEEGPAKDMYHFSVEDTGVGIPQSALDNIFEPFVQSDSAVSRKFGGTGLGLSITRKLVELQGGDIFVESEEGKGTEFSFLVPFGKANATDISYEPEPEKILTFDGKQLLVVDDEKYNRDLFKAMLEKRNISISEAVTGEEGLEELAIAVPDLVLMDVRMPGMGGIAAIKAMKEHQPELPIIALTASIDPETHAEAMEAGALAVISKPVSPADLDKILSTVFGQGKKSFTEIPQDKPAHPSGENEVDISKLAKLSGGDKGFMIQMLNTYLEGLETAESEIAHFMEQKDRAGVALHGHRVAASSRHLGLAGMVFVLKQLEEKADSGEDWGILEVLWKEFRSTKKQTIQVVEAKIKELQQEGQ